MSDETRENRVSNLDLGLNVFSEQLEASFFCTKYEYRGIQKACDRKSTLCSSPYAACCTACLVSRVVRMMELLLVSSEMKNVDKWRHGRYRPAHSQITVFTARCAMSAIHDEM